MRNFVEGYADLSESSKLLHISIFWKKSNYSRLNGNQVFTSQNPCSVFAYCLWLCWWKFTREGAFLSEH